MKTDLMPFRLTSVYSAEAMVASGVRPWHLCADAPAPACQRRHQLTQATLVTASCKGCVHAAKGAAQAQAGSRGHAR